MAVSVAGIWWAPVNLNGLFTYPGRENPCPEGWRLPTFENFEALASLARTGRVTFDHEWKMLKIKSDDGSTELSFPARGYVGMDGRIHESGLTGAYWATSTDSRRFPKGFAGRMLFHGMLIETGTADTQIRMSIRCVKW
ncbi:MAG: fibrobacter succinogenes major paralogous domain-containing protein [Prevotella sp.]|nr:fibrobacter succinogenes major paralogous domain-containing protein [Prevotella sp.]